MVSLLQSTNGAAVELHGSFEGNPGADILLATRGTTRTQRALDHLDTLEQGGGGTVASDRCLLAASAQSSRCQPRSAWFFASASIQFRRRVAMKSRIIGAIAGLICVFALVDIFKPATPYVFYNETASAPVGWYRLTPNRALKRDVIVAACPRKRAEHGRHTGSYGPDGEGFGDAPRMDRGQSL